MNNKPYMPIEEILNLIRHKFLLILFIFCISLTGSYLYNNHYKYIKFNYSLKFMTLSNWRAAEIGIDFKLIDGLTKNMILTLLEEYNPINASVNFENNYVIYFESYKNLKTDNFFEKLTDGMSSNVHNLLKDKEDQLQQEKDNITKIIDKIKKDEKLRLSLRLDILKQESQNTEKVFGKIINSSFDINDELNENKIIIIQNYHGLQKKISNIESQIILMEDTNDGYLYRNDAAFTNAINKLNILDKKIYNLERQIYNFENPNFKTVRLIKDWTIRSNKLSTLEIIMAGILFGLLLNVFYLFITSKYLRNLKLES